MRNRRLLLLLLFLLALSGEALHTLSAHHDAQHCSVCTLQAHDVGNDLHAHHTLPDLFVPHETPQNPDALQHVPAVTRTLFGRAPPHLS